MLRERQLFDSSLIIHMMRAIFNRMRCHPHFITYMSPPLGVGDVLAVVLLTKKNSCKKPSQCTSSRTKDHTLVVVDLLVSTACMI